MKQKGLKFDHSTQPNRLKPPWALDKFDMKGIKSDRRGRSVFWHKAAWLQLRTKLIKEGESHIIITLFLLFLLFLGGRCLGSSTAAATSTTTTPTRCNSSRDATSKSTTRASTDDNLSKTGNNTAEINLHEAQRVSMNYIKCSFDHKESTTTQMQGGCKL